MINYNIEQTVQDLKRTKKAIVAVGCSFVQGAEIADNFQEKTYFSFVNVLCRDYLSNTYTPINFGQEAAGNYAAIMKLFLHDIPWQELEEIVVLFLPTGMQRFDIIRDDNVGVLNSEFKTLWPGLAVSRVNGDQTWFEFNEAYALTTHSKKFEVLNAILNFQILKTWVERHNAKLFVFPAFNKEYSKEYFLENINEEIQRHGKTFLRHSGHVGNHLDYGFLVDSIPWDKFLVIDNKTNFFDLCWSRDKNYNDHYDMYRVIIEQRMADNNWIMPGGHPSRQGHRLLAEKLFEILVSKCSWTHISLSR